MGISQVLLVTRVSAADSMQVLHFVVKQYCLGPQINLFTATDWQHELQVALVMPVFTTKVHFDHFRTRGLGFSYFAYTLLSRLKDLTCKFTSDGVNILAMSVEMQQCC